MKIKHFVVLICVLLFIISFSAPVFAASDNKKPDDLSSDKISKKDAENTDNMVGIMLDYDTCSLSNAFAQLSCGQSKSDTGSVLLTGQMAQNLYI